MTEVAKMMISEHLYAFFLIIIRSVDLNANPFVWGLLLWWTSKKIRFKCIPIQNAYHEVAKWNYALLPYQSTDFVIPFILTNTKHGSKMHSENYYTHTMTQYAHQICPRLLYKSVFFAKFISGLLMNLQNAKLLLSFI